LLDGITQTISCAGEILADLVTQPVFLVAVLMVPFQTIPG